MEPLGWAAAALIIVYSISKIAKTILRELRELLEEFSALEPSARKAIESARRIAAGWRTPRESSAGLETTVSVGTGGTAAAETPSER
ncbi:hypothetical protein ACFQ2M_14435 [Kitasatospora saccharophila]|uniref:hypothetical protein n=1 Tax=Kitasatospora saccharophila TaxID=407973 RepID=UPI0031E186B1